MIRLSKGVGGELDDANKVYTNNDYFHGFCCSPYLWAKSTFHCVLLFEIKS